jgi:hypothetical protein
MLLLLLLFILPIALSVDIIGLYNLCDGPPSASCPGIAQWECCHFRVGRTTRSIRYRGLQSHDIGAWAGPIVEDGNIAGCGPTRHAIVGGFPNICIKYTAITPYPFQGGLRQLPLGGGGGFWFNCVQTLALLCGAGHPPRHSHAARAESRRAESESFTMSDLNQIDALGSCNATVHPIVWAWEGGGVWKLKLSQLDDDDLEAFMSEEATDDVSGPRMRNVCIGWC